MINLIQPNWPAPKNVKAFTTTRNSGVSQGAFASFNLAHHVNDDLAAVKQNRAILQQVLQLPKEPVWLTQIHGIKAVQAENTTSGVEADAVYTRKPGNVCAVLTADCLPILVCDKNGEGVAAIHAGWRGLAAGIIEETIKILQIPGKQLLVWLGPAIGPQAFEVGEEVLQEFINVDPQAKQAFKAINNNKWLGDIYLLAKQRLQMCDVNAVYGGDFCTYTDESHFYSYRRDNQTGRMASLIWLQE